MNSPHQILQHLDASGQLGSLWKQFRDIERPHRVESAHAPDYEPLLKTLREIARNASQVVVVHPDDAHSRDSLLREIAEEEAKLQGRVPQFVREGLCS